MDFDVDAEFVRQALEFEFPQTHARAVAAAAVSRNDEPGRLGIAPASDFLPPAADCLNREGGSIVVHPDTDPAIVGREIIDCVGNSPTQFLDHKVMNPNFFGIPLWSPFTTIVLEIANQLLLPGVHRDDGLVLRLG